jgi:CarD family transcriptional regulator
VTFEVGDKVIYPNHGLRIVRRIEDKPSSAPPAAITSVVANDTTVLVPLANVDGVGLRRAISDDEVERLFTLLGTTTSTTRTGRALQDSSDRCAAARSWSRRRPQEPHVSHKSEPLVPRSACSIAPSSHHRSVGDARIGAIEARVDRALERCFTTKARTTARTTAPKVAPKVAPRGDRRRRRRRTRAS